MDVKLKKFIIFILFCVSLNAKELLPITLQLAWKYQFQFAGYIMAKEKGFYSDVGLDVNLKEYENGLYALTEVKNKKAQFGIGRSDLIVERLNNKGQYLQLLALCQASPVQLQTIKENGIEKISDLKGKKLLIYNNDKPIISIFSMLSSVGISENDITFVNSPTYDLKEITDGTADVLTGYSTITPYQYKNMGYTPISFHPKDYGFDFYGDVLFTTQEYENLNPDVVKKFYKASLKGWEYAFLNIEETINTIKAKYDTQKLERSLLEFEANEYKKLAFFPGVPFGEINPIKLEKIANTLKLLGKTKSSTIDFEDFIYNPNANENNISLTKEEKAFIKNNPIIKVGVRKDLNPIDFITKSGLHSGLSHDILEFISQQSGLRFIYLENKEDELVKKLSNNKIDLIISTKNINQENLLSTKPFFTLNEEHFIHEINGDGKIHQLKTKTTNLSFVLKKDAIILESIVSKIVNQMSDEQKLALENKWIPKVVKEKFDWTIIWQIISIFAFVIIGLLYKNIQQKKSEKKRLSQQVDEKTKDLQIALDDKALLLKELNHRVKNNMQTIVSMIRLQNDKVDDEKLNNVFTTIQNRINAMSHLHELLYQQDNITKVDASEYFELVIEELKGSFFDKNVLINYDIKTNLVLDQAIYCGIILNELVTNSFKYAFPNGEGEINIQFFKKDSKYFLIIEDNGVAYDVNKSSNSSLGLMLVNRLVKRQLKGEINIDVLNGVKVQITWEDNGKN